MSMDRYVLGILNTDLDPERVFRPDPDPRVFLSPDSDRQLCLLGRVYITARHIGHMDLLAPQTAGLIN